MSVIAAPPGKSYRLLGGAHLLRGRRAKRGLVAWNQPSEGESGYNTVRPFWLAKPFIGWWGWLASRETDATALLDWIAEMDEKRDWREVSLDRIEDLEEVAADLKAFGLWHLGLTEEQGAKQPFGTKKPFPDRAVRFLEGYAQVIKCAMICRIRIQEGERLADRKRREYGKISAALNEAESAARVKAWQEREAVKA